MERAIEKHRAYTIFGFLVFFVSIVILRLLDMQILRVAKYQKLAEINARQTIPVPALRGKIFDRNGDIIAFNNAYIGLYTILRYLPKDPKKRMEVIKRACEVTGINFDKAWAEINSQKYDEITPIFLGLIKDKNNLVYLSEHISEFPGIFYDTKYARMYKYLHSISHVVGYTGLISKSELEYYKNVRKSDKYYLGSVVGKMGLEKMYDEILRGEDGIYVRIVDSANNILDERYEKLPVPGMSLVISIDAELQQKAYELLGGARGAVVVSKPATGEILALVSSPGFDPNAFALGDTSEFQRLATHPDKPFYNRAIQGTYSPGSIFKLVTAIAGLNEHKINENSSEYCQGWIKIGDRIFKDWDVHGFVPDIYTAIQKSCDVYFYKLGLIVGPENLIKYTSLLGFGKPTGIDIPWEEAGFVPDLVWHRKRYGKPWLKGDTANHSIGQGDWLFTPLQLNTLVSLIVNEGIAYKPHLVIKITDYSGEKVIKEIKPEILYKVDDIIDKNVFKIIKRAMRKVVEEGTASVVKWYTKIPMAGKTATIQNPHGQDHSGFVCFAPYGENVDPNEVIAISVIGENMGYGASFSAPIAAKLVEFYFSKKTAQNLSIR